MDVHMPCSSLRYTILSFLIEIKDYYSDLNPNLKISFILLALLRVPHLPYCYTLYQVVGG